MSNTIDSAISAIIRRRPAAGPPEKEFVTLRNSVLVVLKAGIRPNTTPVTTATARLNPSTRPSRAGTTARKPPIILLVPACGSSGNRPMRAGAGHSSARNSLKLRFMTSHKTSCVRLSGTGSSSPTLTGSTRLCRTAWMLSRKHSSVGPASKISM